MGNLLNALPLSGSLNFGRDLITKEDSRFSQNSPYDKAYKFITSDFLDARFNPLIRK